ncbi:MAG: class I SAM-dependent methyltransferase [Ferrovibrio sp.]
MEQDKPSQTASEVAYLRAVHQVSQNGTVFKDPYAIKMSGKDEAWLKEFISKDARRMAHSNHVVARSRFSEDRSHAAIARGTCQVVILGAGFDTFGMRNNNLKVKVFEVDHPATQQEKRQRINTAGWTPPDNLIFVETNFENENFVDKLKACGFDPASPAFFSWLGVVTYLEKKAAFATLRSISEMSDPEIVFDYGMPLEAYPLARHADLTALLDRMKERGEPWIGLYNPTDLHARLRELGFSRIEDLGPQEIHHKYKIGEQLPYPNQPGGHFLHATKGI